MSTVRETVNGAHCIPTGKRGVRDSSGFVPKDDGSWLYCQMLPIVPQRFEWIRSSNLKPVKDHGK